MAARCEMPEVPQHPSKAKKKMALCRGKGPARHRYPHEHRPTRWYPHNPARRLGPEGASERAPKKGDFSGACSKEEKTCGDCWETRTPWPSFPWRQMRPLLASLDKLNVRRTAMAHAARPCSRRTRGARTFFVGSGNGANSPSTKTAGLYSSGTPSCITGLFLNRSTCASRP